MAGKIKYSANYRRNYTAIFAAVIFFAMIVGEIAIGIGVPLFMRRENVLADRINRISFLLFFDSVRWTCDRITTTDEVIELEKKTVSSVLNQMASYLRYEGEHLTPEEVAELTRLTRSLYRVVAVLNSGKQISGEHRLNTANYINALVKQHSGGNK